MAPHVRDTNRRACSWPWPRRAMQTRRTLPKGKRMRWRSCTNDPPPACRMTRAGTGVSWVERTWTGRRNQRWAEAVSHYRQREAAWLDGRWRKRGRLSGDSPPKWLAKLEGKRFVAVTELPKAGEAVSLPTG